MNIKLLIYIFLCGIRFHYICGGRANFYVKLISFSNPYSIDQTGYYCDNYSWSKQSKETNCDHFFIITWHPKLSYGQSGFPRGTIRTKVFQDTDYIDFTSYLGNGHSNPLIFNLTDYAGMLNLRVDIWDEDKEYPDYEDDKVDLLQTSLFPLAVGIPTWKEPTKYSTTLRGKHYSTMNIKYWVECHSHWYGKTCGRYCKATDINTVGHYTCNANGQKICLEGWLNPDSSCLTRNYCHNGPCLNGGICSTRTLGFFCHCQVGYNGTRCETKLPRCDYDNPCQNMGTCHWSNTNVDQFWCTCLKGYRGTYCEQDINECLPINPCQNNGTCTNFGGGYQCNCHDRHYGKHCEKFYNPCDILRCQNNATCVNVNSTYTCHCPPGFNGTHCETFYHPCDILPCQNNATCINGTNAIGDEFYVCECREGYFGKFCQNTAAAKSVSKPDSYWIPIGVGCIVFVMIIALILLVICIRRHPSRRRKARGISVTTLTTSIPKNNYENDAYRMNEIEGDEEIYDEIGPQVEENIYDVIGPQSRKSGVGSSQ